MDAVDADGKPIFDDNRRRKKEEKEISVPAFKVVSVFDVSQTEGEPLPSLGVSELTGNVDKYKEFLTALEKISAVPIEFEKIDGNAKGYFSSSEKRIAIKEGMSELQNLKTLIHEIAHSRLHDIDKNAPNDTPRPDRRTREVEAESIAYTVCQHYGLDTSDYSFGYVASWSGDKQLDTLKSSLDTIRKEADAIITEVDKHLAELMQDKAQTIEKPSQDLQEAKQGLREEAKATLQFFIDCDMKDFGKIRRATLEMIAVQGFEYRIGKLEEAPPIDGTFTIYQLKDSDETRDFRFQPFEKLKEIPGAASYKEIYNAPLKPGDTLDSIYMMFNLNKPEDFKGHSLSVSDVVVMNRNGEETAFYVDSIGFKELPDFLHSVPEQSQYNRIETLSAVHSNYKDMIALIGADNKVYLGKSDNYNFISPAVMPWHKPEQEYGNEPSYYDNSDNSLIFISDNPKMYDFISGDGWQKSQADMLKDNTFTQADYKEFARIQSEVISGLPYKDNFTGIKFDGKPFDPTLSTSIDLTAVADYLQKQNSIIQAADPNKTQGQAAFNMAIKRLDGANAKIPDKHPRLKALITLAVQSPGLATLKERMNTMHNEFIQHYSTAVQMTLDTSAKAEPIKTAVSSRQNAPKMTNGENVAAIEARIKAGEVINLTELSDAIKKDNKAAQSKQTAEKSPAPKSRTQTNSRSSKDNTKQPSIKEQLAAGKKQLGGQKSEPIKVAAQNKNKGLED